MKKTISTLGSILLVLTLVLSLGCGNGEKYTDPVDYNDAIIHELSALDPYFTALDSIAGEDEFNYTSYEKTRKEAIEKVAECEASIKDIGTFEKDDALQKAALDYMDGAKTLFENDWKNIGAKVKIVDELSDDEIQKLSDFVDEAYAKYDNMNNNFSDVQEKFAEDHNFELE